uniref:Uncharacterized protein n=1 Tax=Glossina pallidipes TaxID=7398 RepID=A0A1A9ZT41_GLOPL
MEKFTLSSSKIPWRNFSSTIVSYIKSFLSFLLKLLVDIRSREWINWINQGKTEPCEEESLSQLKQKSLVVNSEQSYPQANWKKTYFSRKLRFTSLPTKRWLHANDSDDAAIHSRSVNYANMLTTLVYPSPLTSAYLHQRHQ